MITWPSGLNDMLAQASKTLKAIENYYLQKAMREAGDSVKR